jgi:hypothetical protein
VLLAASCDPAPNQYYAPTRKPQPETAESVGEAKFAKTIPQKVGDGHMWDANGKVDMIAGILRLCYHWIC